MSLNNIRYTKFLRTRLDSIYHQCHKHQCYSKDTRMLATANRSRVSIRDRLCETFLHIYSLITMQNVVVLVHTVCAHEGPRNFGGRRGPASLARERG